MSEPRTVSQLVALGERVLDDSTHIFEDHVNIDQARELLASVLRISPDDLDEDLEPPKVARDRYLALIARRAAGEPQPFLTGWIEFYGLHLKVWPGAFVPRPSSELTVDRALFRLRRKRAPVVVDVAAGTGPIALAVGTELPSAEVWALDIDPTALDHGRRNARRLGIGNVRFRTSDMYGALPAGLDGRVDLITAHVPYVPAHELEDLPTEVRDHEPMHTLTDEQDGLYLLRRAVQESIRLLKPGGWLLLELSDDFAPKASRLVRSAGLRDEGVASDDDGLSVVVEARKPGPAGKPR
ncbi:MAG TPA: HemK/PrmC family methyltransferase [Actinomycetota bacterium]|nr:HemK/PrmC family methyltransferase [Actinomycetota bacterium]